MADVTISGLNPGTPSSTDVLPYSNGSSTLKVQVQSLPVAWASVTGKPSIGTNASGNKYVFQNTQPSTTSGYSEGDIWYQW